MSLRPGLSGYVPVRNGNSLDYCWQLAVGSLLAVADEVIISDGGSTDGTLEEARAWADRDPKIRVVEYPWPDPVGDVQLLPKWLNWTRQHCRYSNQITLDADEVLCPASYPAVKHAAAHHESRWFERLNFWIDPAHIAPHHTVCAHVVVRQGPTEWEMVSDGFYDKEPDIKVYARRDARLRIFHLGFLRRREAFYAKSKIMQRALLNTYDARLKESEENGQPWTANCSNWKDPLLTYSGGFPPEVAEWLRARGYSV